MAGLKDIVTGAPSPGRSLRDIVHQDDDELRPLPVAPATPAPDTNVSYDTTGHQATPTGTSPNVRVSPGGMWDRNTEASLKEDWRRTKEFGGSLVDIVKKGWDAQAQVGDFLTNGDALKEPSPQDLQGTPYADPTILSRQMDTFLRRPPLEQLQVIGHGLLPGAVDSPPTAQDTRPGIMTQLASAKDKAFQPIVKGVRENITQPLMESAAPMIAQAVTNPVGLVTGENTREQAQGIAGLNLLAGRMGAESMVPEEGSPEALDAVNGLERHLGQTGAGIAQFGAEQVGQLPLYILTSGLGRTMVAEEEMAALTSAKLTTPEVTAGKLADIATKEGRWEGVGQGIAQTLVTPGQDIVTAPVAFGLLGGLQAKVASRHIAEAKVMHHHSAVMPAKTWDTFTQEIEDLIANTQPVARTPLTPKGPHVSQHKLTMDVASGKTKPGDLIVQQPTKKGVITGPDQEFDRAYSTVARNSDGRLVGREVQMKLLDNGKVEMTNRDTVIHSYGDADSWLKKVGNVSRGSGPSSRANYGEFLDLLQGPVNPFPKGRIAFTAGYAPPEVVGKVPGVAKRVRQQEVEKLMAAEKTSLTGTPTREEGVVVNVNEKGNLKVTPVAHPEPKEAGTWKLAPGDLVLTPDQEAYIVKGFSPEGKVLAKKPGAGGRPRSFRNEDLKFVADKDGLTSASWGPPRQKPVGIPNAEAAPLPDDYMKVIDDLKVVTIPRLVKAFDMNPGEAGQVLNKLLAEGKVKYAKGTIGGWGVFEVHQPHRVDGPLRYEPWGDVPQEVVDDPRMAGFQRKEGPVNFPGAKVHGLNEPVQDGMEVWFRNSPLGRAMKGVLRGPDPKNPKHYLIEVPHENVVQKLEAAGALAKLPGAVQANGDPVLGVTSKDATVMSVPQEVLRTVIPTTLAKKQLSKLYAVPGLYGLNVPHPDGFIVASKGNAEAIRKATEIAQQARFPALSKKVETIKGQLLNAYYLTPPMLRNKATTLFPAWPAARDAQVRIAERIKEGTGGYGTQADQDLIHVLETSHVQGANIIAMKDWAMKNPQASRELMTTLKDLLDERKALSQWMADNGLANIDTLEQMRDVGEEPEYLTAIYSNRALKDKYPEWVKNNMPDVWDAAVRELSRGTRNAAMVESELARILLQDDALKSLSKSGLVNNEAFGKLLQRKDIQSKYPAIYKLMGPVPSAALRLGHTIGYQRAIKAQVEAWNAIHDSEWWSPGVREDLQLPVPNDPKFGSARGGFTHESLKNFVLQKPEDKAGALLRMLGWMGGKWKSFHTVYGGPTPWVNNIVRNFKGVMISGAYEGPEDLEGFRRAPSLLLGWRDNPSMLGPHSIVGEAKQFGALSSGFAGAEITDARARIQSELLLSMNKAAGHATSMEDMVMAAQDFMRNKSENVKDAYDAIDQYFKLATYVNLRKRYISKSMSIHDAAATATEDINSAYPNFELVGPAIEKVRGNFGIAAPFLSSKAEDLRINAMTAARLARRDPGLSLRVAASSVALGSAYGLMSSLRRANGISDQDVIAGQNALSLRQQSFRPALVPMWDYDAKGRMQFMDLTPMEDLFMMLRGNPQDPMLNRVLVNNAIDLFGQDTLPGRGIQSAAQSVGLLSDGPQDAQKLGYGEGGILNFMGDYARWGGVPQAPIRAMDAYAKTQPNDMNPASEPWTTGQALGKGMGLPVAGPVGVGSMVGSLREAKGAIRGLKHEAKGIPRRLAGDARDKFLLDAKLRGIENTTNRINEIQVPPSKSGGNK